jgi:ParB/RepB/Spo0J family partition protein
MIANVQTKYVLANPWQTRSRVDYEYISDLAEDILRNGLLQTPVGRMLDSGRRPVDALMMSRIGPRDIENGIMAREGYFVEIAFGHNRLEAYRYNEINLGPPWQRMPVEIRQLTDEQMAQYAWAENEQHRDISPIERARAIQKRLADFRWTQEQAANKLGIARSTIANILRLLKLPEDIQEELLNGQISERQALALLPVADSEQAAEIVQAAVAGASSDEIRERVSQVKQELEEPDPQMTFEDTTPATFEPLPEFDTEQERWTNSEVPSLDFPTPEIPEEEPEPETEPVVHPPAPVAAPAASPKPAATPAPDPQPETPEEPETWEKSIIQATITWSADGGMGRFVAVGMKAGSKGIPGFRTIRMDEPEVTPALVNLLTDLLIDLRSKIDGEK